MKIEPKEYLVTHDDGKTSSVEWNYVKDSWHADGYHLHRLGYFKTSDEALGVLKKWKEMQDEN